RRTQALLQERRPDDDLLADLGAEAGAVVHPVPMTRAMRAMCCALLLGVAAILPPAGLHAQTISSDSAAKRRAKGKGLFQGRGLCLSCHGRSAEGISGLGPRLMGATLVHTKGSVAELVELITTGIDSAHSKSGVVMPPKGGSRLSATDVEMVAEYVQTLRK